MTPESAIGESVVVFGAGGVGLNVIQGAALAGAFPIIAVDLFDNRLELAGRFGATHMVNSSTCDSTAAITGILAECGQPEGADVCIDNTGNAAVIEQAYRLCGARGRVVCVGVPAHGENVSIYTLPLHFGKRITGSHGGEAVPHEDIPVTSGCGARADFPLTGWLRKRILLNRSIPPSPGCVQGMPSADAALTAADDAW